MSGSFFGARVKYRQDGQRMLDFYKNDENPAEIKLGLYLAPGQ